MSGLWPQLALVAVLVLLNAAFSGTEMALVSLREGQLQRLEQRSSTGALVARLARDPNNFLATIQIGITLAGFLASAAAAVSLSEPLEEQLDFLGGAGPARLDRRGHAAAGLRHAGVGELAPKRVAMQRAERWALLAARPLWLMSKLTRPVVWLLSRSTDLAVRLMGGDPNVQREQVTEAELRELVGTQASFTPKQRHDHRRRLRDRRAHARRGAACPGPTCSCSTPTGPPTRALQELAASGHSRAPVAHDGNLDDVVGVVHLRDLLGPGRPAGGRAGGRAGRLPRDGRRARRAARDAGPPRCSWPWWSTSTAPPPASSPSRTCSRSWSARSTTRPTATSSACAASPTDRWCCPAASRCTTWSTWA